MRLISIACAALIAAIVGAGPAWAQGASKSAKGTSTVGTVFTDIEKRIIDEYYRLKARAVGDPGGPAKKPAGTMRGIPKEVGKKSADDDDAGPGKGKGKGKGIGQSQGKSDELPPGLAKKDQLPPGLAKKDKLPPGLKRDKLPADLVAKLPAPRRGSERVLIGDDLVLIDQKTQVVLDILKNATLLAQ